MVKRLPRPGLEHDVMAYLEGPEVVKDAKMTYVKKGRKCRRITKKKRNPRNGESAKGLPEMGIQDMAKEPKDYPKWEFRKGLKCRLITRNGKTRNGQRAERLPKMGI